MVDKNWRDQGGILKDYEYEEINDLVRRRIETFGILDTLMISVEEMAELQQALSKYNRYGETEAVIEELVDVMICLVYIRTALDISSDDMNLMTRVKLDRLEKLLNNLREDDTLCNRKEVDRKQ